MVETITPVVHGGRGKWAGAFALHVAGATVAAASFGALLGAVGRLLGAPWGRAGAVALAGGALIYAFHELPKVTVSVPQLRRQVPEWWRTFFAPPVTALLYGAGLGIGFLTYLAHGTLVVVAAAAAASGDPWWGAVLVGTFGFARGASAVLAHGVDTEEAGQELVERLVARSDVARRAAHGAALVVVALAAAAAAFRSEGGFAALAGALVAAAFAWAAVAKLANGRRWQGALGAHRLPRSVERVATWGTPLAELVVPVLAVLGLRRASAAWALVLLVVFSAEVVRVRRRVGPSVPCGCFGGRRELAASTQLLRNTALGSAAILALVAAPDAPVVSWPGMPVGEDLIPAVLATVGVLVAVWTAWRSATWLGRAGRA
jgi:hypothetical protein